MYGYGFLAVTYKTGSIKIYLAGAGELTTTRSGATEALSFESPGSDVTPFIIGAPDMTGLSTTQMEINDIKVWNLELTASEINALHSLG